MQVYRHRVFLRGNSFQQRTERNKYLLARGLKDLHSAGKLPVTVVSYSLKRFCSFLIFD